MGKKDKKKDKKKEFLSEEISEEISEEKDLEVTKVSKEMKGWIAAAVVALFAVIVLANSCSIVQQRERGVKYTFGKASEQVIQPGLVWHKPFVSKIKKYSIVPKTYKVNFEVGNDQGAITKDLQTVAAEVVVRYQYDEVRLLDIAMKFGDSMIEQAMETKIISSVKEEVGKYTIYDLVAEQGVITKNVGELVSQRMTEFPIKVTTVDITNWSWSDSFDNQIKQTAERTQQIRTAQQEAEIAAAQAQKKVKEAEADKQAAQLYADATVAKAEGEAKAKKIAADATAYENQKIAQNLSVMQAQWKHEENMAEFNKWDGRKISDQSVYVPNTYDLKSGK